MLHWFWALLITVTVHGHAYHFTDTGHAIHNQPECIDRVNAMFAAIKREYPKSKPRVACVRLEGYA